MANEIDPDEALQLMQGLRESVKSDFASFKKKIASGVLSDPPSLARELEDLFSLVVDLSEMTLNAHAEHIEWSSGIEEELDELKEGGGSSLVQSDAENIKALLLSLQQNLRAAVDSADTVPGMLTERVKTTLAFIDEITATPDEEEEEEEEEEDNDEPEGHNKN